MFKTGANLWQTLQGDRLTAQNSTCTVFIFSSFKKKKIYFASVSSSYQAQVVGTFAFSLYITRCVFKCGENGIKITIYCRPNIDWNCVQATQRATLQSLNEVFLSISWHFFASKSFFFFFSFFCIKKGR